jgi:hypothetical protein
VDLDEAELLRRDAPLPVRRRHQFRILRVQQLLAAHHGKQHPPPNQPPSSTAETESNREARTVKGPGPGEASYQCDDAQKLAAILLGTERSRRAWGSLAGRISCGQMRVGAAGDGSVVCVGFVQKQKSNGSVGSGRPSIMGRHEVSAEGHPDRRLFGLLN